MDAPEIVEVANDPPAIETLALSPDARASLVINLIGEITVTGIAEDDHDLSLSFLTFQPAEAGARLSECVPHPYLSPDLPWIGSSPRADALRGHQGPSGSSHQRTRRRFLTWAREVPTSAGPIVEDDDKLMARLNFFSFGHQVFQYTLLHTAALNSVTAEYLKIIPVINQINDCLLYTSDAADE